MSTGRSEPGPAACRRSCGWRLLAPALLATCLLAGAAGCSVGGDDAEGSPRAAAVDVAEGVQQLLDARARAVRQGDERAFRAGLARDRRGLVRQQTTWFDNVQQLPLGTLRFTLDRDTLVRQGDGYWAVVDVSVRLDGYDTDPVMTPDRWPFLPRPDTPDGFVVASVTDRRWERQAGMRPEPWDLGPVEVRSVPGVLGVFDAASLPAAPGLLDSVQRGLAAVAGVVPLEWSRSVVLYALSDGKVLASVADLPGVDPEMLDGVSFPVFSRPDGERTASTRFVLHPRMLWLPGEERDRLVRHELTHVALGAADDAAPLWLSEGIAEYVSVRALAPQDRQVAPAAVEAARVPDPDLPEDQAFVAGDPAVHYGLSWWICEYIAGSYGEQTLWTLLERLGSAGADVESVLVEILGLRPDQLARRGADTLLATYGVQAVGATPARPPGE